MSDEQVKGFVDRYIPAYVFFGRGVQDGGDGVSRLFAVSYFYAGAKVQFTQLTPPWISRGLQLVVDENRDVVQSSTF